MVNAVALFHRGNRMKHRTGSTTVMLLALMVYVMFNDIIRIVTG